MPDIETVTVTAEAVMTAVINQRRAAAGALAAAGGWAHVAQAAGLPAEMGEGVTALSRRALAAARFAASHADPGDPAAVRLAQQAVDAAALEYEMFGGDPTDVEGDHVRVQVTVDGHWQGWLAVPVAWATQGTAGWSAHLTAAQFAAVH